MNYLNLLSQLTEFVFGVLHAPRAKLVICIRVVLFVNIADTVRTRVGGKEAIIAITGSDAPLRFSAFGIRRTAIQEPDIYNNTKLIHQLSSFIPAVLSAKWDSPLGMLSFISHQY